MTRISAVTFLVVTAISLAAAQTQPRRELLVRCDDIGMCHSVNMALQQVVDAGIPFSASIMFPCPWYQEAVEILRGKTQVAVGIHLVLNAEWKNYRWGPVAGAHTVPSLVDSVGYFFPSRAATLAHHPTLVDAERELRAQIHRALASGLQISYLDTHMSTLDETQEFRDLVERLSAEYHLPISRSYGERDVEGIYTVPPAQKTDYLIDMVNRAVFDSPLLFVFHIGLDTPEMQALKDMNSFGLAEMSKHREGELHALTSPEFRAAVNRRSIRLVNYRDFLASSTSPAVKQP
jgi:hypothetical protein